MSDTPRTDAEAFTMGRMGSDPPTQFVPADVARGLERELAEKSLSLSEERNTREAIQSNFEHECKGVDAVLSVLGQERTEAGTFNRGKAVHAIRELREYAEKFARNLIDTNTGRYQVDNGDGTVSPGDHSCILCDARGPTEPVGHKPDCVVGAAQAYLAALSIPSVATPTAQGNPT